MRKCVKLPHILISGIYRHPHNFILISNTIILIIITRCINSQL